LLFQLAHFHDPAFSIITVSVLQAGQQVAGWSVLLSSDPYFNEINLIVSTQLKAPHLTCGQYPACHRYQQSKY